MVGGTGTKLTEATIVVCGVASLIATLMSVVSIWLQLKNYRKPLLQRYVVRILVMVPIYSIASWCSMVSDIAARILDPIRDIYEAFTIYTFFQLLINYLDGERALIIMTHGREPIRHLWPMNHVFDPIDISDPHSFLAIKRGILQYAWLKPILALATVIMQVTNTYQEGYIGLNSGYLWSGIIYNLSVSISLYSLGLFWVCTHHDLIPFRPVPKFLCVKLIIFASYWQGFLLSILVSTGALPDDVEGYTPDNLAAAIQDALICIEMPAFAMAHWYAFSWHDFADDTVQAARLPVKYAFRDAFGIRDLIEDSKLTFRGDNYAYRDFDSNDKILAHESSRSRVNRLKAGMRYERGGKGKYWIASPDRANARDADPYTPLLGGGNSSQSAAGPSRSSSQSEESSSFEAPALDADMEVLYDNARKLEYGDWNYPVIPANHLSRQDRWRSPTPSSLQQRASPFRSPPSPAVSQSADTAKAQVQDLPPTVVVAKKKSKQRKVSSSKAQTKNQKTPSVSAPVANNAAATLPPPPSPPSPKQAESTVQAEASQLWPQSDESPVDEIAEPEETTTSPRYDLQGDEFQNVWGR